MKRKSYIAVIFSAFALTLPALASPVDRTQPVDRAITTEKLSMMEALNTQMKRIDTGIWGQGMPGRAGGAVSVGPGCDYANLQDAIDDAMNLLAPGQIGVHTNYQFSQGYSMSNSSAWRQNLWIMGGFETCNVDDPGTGTTTLDAQGSDRLFAIERTADAADPSRGVRLENFVLTGGNGGNNSRGGAIWLSGTSGRTALELVNVEVSNNSAALFGGGIHMVSVGNAIVDDPANPPPPLLYVDDDSFILGNSTDGPGGGIRCLSTHTQNPGYSFLRTGAGLIAGNEADSGGGVSVSSCHFVLRNGGPVALLFPSGGLVSNTARVGGGLHAENGAFGSLSGVGDSEFGGDPESSALVLGNEAAVGGGLYVTGPETQVFGFSLVIRANNALEQSDGSGGDGGGIHASNQATVALERAFTQAACEFPPSSGGLLNFPLCNRIEANQADINGGGVMAVDGAIISLRKTYLLDNFASVGGATHARNNPTFGDDPLAHIRLSDSLVTGNDSTTHTFYVFSGGHTEIHWSTIADNDYGSGGSLFRVFARDEREARLDLFGSIVWGPDVGFMVTRSGKGDTIALADCVIGFRDAADTDLTSTDYYSQVDPEFVDPNNGNYRLASTSPAIDYCSGISSPEDFDLDFRPRGVEHSDPTTPAPNPEPGGLFDLGAYEFSSDQMFSDRFEL